MSPARIRFVPKDSALIEHTLGVVYTHEREGRYLVLGYRGKATTKAFYFSFATAAARDKQIAEFFAGLEASAAIKARFREERSKAHTVAVGDILHHSWGWEQTNCDYYQVLTVTAHGATIQAIGDQTVPGSTISHGMADQRTAVRDSFQGEPLRVKIDGRNYVCVTKGRLSHGTCSPWDGQPSYCSWYA